MDRYVCIHGHFYQPPRENPWLERIELQDSAYPYHDWNERITAECYAPNATSRILDGEGFVARIVNNYSKISFNFGPTLLAWLEERAPDVYDAVLRADRRSRRAFSGHGSAIAQAYNHAIMPLANARDKETEALWGVRDFEHRFRRKPEAMWLPETAVDLETLEILAALGLRFTILAPHQAARVRAPGASEWQDVRGGRVDPRQPYRIRLPSGRTLALFFYDGQISRDIAFQGLLTSGDELAGRLLAGFDERERAQLVHVATDGETYGHHHRHGEMALSYALERIETSEAARLTNYGEFLAKRPPEHEVEIEEHTSWSCAHGVERWRSNCGCNTGAGPGWNQAWRAPLREALDWLRDELASLYERRAAHLLRDPWAARNDYISVILDRSPENVAAFFERHATRDLNDSERVAALQCLELQRHALLMYTSCGWFFDDLSGIETVQVIQYAGRAIQLARDLTGEDVEEPFLERLAHAKSNIPEQGDGRQIYQRFVRPAMVDLPQVCAHYAVASLFEAYEDEARVYAYRVRRHGYQQLEAGRMRLVFGDVRVTSETTLQSARLSFGLLHFGDHNVHGGVRSFQSEEAHRAMTEEIAEPFRAADHAAVIHALDRNFGTTFSLRSLFRDEQRRVMDGILDQILGEAEDAYRRLYAQHAPLMNFLAEIGIGLPGPVKSATEFVINTELRRLLAQPEPDVERVRALVGEARTRRVALDEQGLAFAFGQALEHAAARSRRGPLRGPLLSELETLVELAGALPFDVDLRRLQNAYYDILQRNYPRLRAKALAGDERSQKLAARFASLGQRLRVRVPA